MKFVPVDNKKINNMRRGSPAESVTVVNPSLESAAAGGATRSNSPRRLDPVVPLAAQ